MKQAINNSLPGPFQMEGQMLIEDRTTTSEADGILHHDPYAAIVEILENLGWPDDQQLFDRFRSRNHSLLCSQVRCHSITLDGGGPKRTLQIRPNAMGRLSPPLYF
jgi:hypothetical protein